MTLLDASLAVLAYLLAVAGVLRAFHLLRRRDQSELPPRDRTLDLTGWRR